MKYTLLALAIAFAAATPEAQASTSYSQSRPSGSASSGDFGIGLMVGEPTGLTAKYWLSNDRALDIGLTYSLRNYLEILFDHNWHFPSAFGRSKTASAFVPYLGIGAAFFIDTGDRYAYSYKNGHFTYFRPYGESSFALGARIPLGLEFLPSAAPIGVFAEIVPGVGMFPGVFGFFQGAVGVRFYI